jgi:hypothetical protein
LDVQLSAMSQENAYLLPSWSGQRMLQVSAQTQTFSQEQHWWVIESFSKSSVPSGFVTESLRFFYRKNSWDLIQAS